MELEDMILVSIDDHVIEPPDLFEGRMPARFADQAPKFVRGANGADQWEFCGKKAGPVGIGAVASWPLEEWSLDPVGHAEMRPGCYDIDERVRDMDANGIYASMNFPTMAGFSGAYLARGEDPELVAATIAAYNDWHIDEWCGSHPDRFIPLAILPFWSPEKAAAEIHRVARKGCTAFTLPEVPYQLRLPSFKSDYWAPVFQAACEEDMVCCLHIGLAISIIPNPDGRDDGRMIIMGPQVTAITANDLLNQGVFKRFPDLKVALSEGGIGWIAGYLDRADKHVQQHIWTNTDISGTDLTPTEVFRRNMLACFIDDPTALRVRDRIGIDSIAWECDYPHTDSTWPNSPENLFGQLAEAGCADEEIHKITWENACRFFRWDPFAHRDQAAATVGALRARARDVDVSTTSKEVYRARYAEKLAAGTR